jgi:hypothetical protein
MHGDEDKEGKDGVKREVKSVATGTYYGCVGLCYDDSCAISCVVFIINNISS